MVDLERDTQPVEREGSVEFDFSALLHLLGLLGSAEQGLAGAQYVLDEASPEFCRCGSRILLVDEVGEAEQLRFGIVDGDGELLEVLGGAGLFGNAIESGAESFGALALGDVAIDGVEGDGLAVDDEGSGGNGNVEQGAVLTSALSFEGDVLAALEALGDPFGFGGALGGKNEVVDGFAEDLRGGVAEHALKLLIKALRAEGSIRNDERVGRVLKELFEILAADAEVFFRSDFRGILLLGICFSRIFYRIPRKGGRLFDGVGGCRWNERRCGSALERLAQTLGTH